MFFRGPCLTPSHTKSKSIRLNFHSLNTNFVLKMDSNLLLLNLLLLPYNSTLECKGNNCYTSAMETVKPYHLACLLPRQPNYRHKGKLPENYIEQPHHEYDRNTSRKYIKATMDKGCELLLHIWQCVLPKDKFSIVLDFYQICGQQFTQSSHQCFHSPVMWWRIEAFTHTKYDSTSSHDRW